MKDITLLLRQAARGRKEAIDEIMPIIVSELRAIAVRQMKGERSDHTLQPTALVNEVYMRLVNEKAVDYRDRNHFFAIASRRMREILINHANSRQARKRGQGWRRISFVEGVHDAGRGELDLVELVALDEALERMAARPADRSRRMARMVELRLFGGMTSSDIAAYLEVSTRTVERDLKAAIMILLAEIRGEGPRKDRSGAGAGTGGNPDEDIDGDDDGDGTA